MKEDLLSNAKKRGLEDYMPNISDGVERKRIQDSQQSPHPRAETPIKELRHELFQVKRELKAETERRKQAEEILAKREPYLRERMKEISALYSLVSLLASTKYKSDEEKLRDVVNVIRTGWQYPEDTCVRILFQGKEYRTANFGETPWCQTADIVIKGTASGFLEVGFLKEKPPKDEGPFLLEERTLIDVMAKIIGEMLI